MIRESTENYLETIYILSQRMKDVRSIDVCNELGYSKPTISVAMKQFREQKLIEMDGNGYITLTPAGLEIAVQTYERHEVLSKMLMLLGVQQETALAVLLLWRTFSKNLTRRRAENTRFVNWWWPRRSKLLSAKARYQDKEHKYFTCKTCKTICRVPVGKGKIEITCPKCRSKIMGKS